MAQIMKLVKFKIYLSSYVRFLKIKASPRTAGIIVIGDEILNGQVADTNSPFLLLRLHKLGIAVEKVSIIKDNINDISKEVEIFSKNYTYVLTTGGIGPTHDDVTFEAVAKAFDEPLIHHPDLVRICSRFYKTDDINHPGMKLAKIPQACELNYAKDKSKYPYPCISIENVYIFPGVPPLMQKLFASVEAVVFDGNSNRFYTKSLFLKEHEENIVAHLNTIVKKYPIVKVGSYPELYNNEYNVKITLISECDQSLSNAFKEFLTLLPKRCVVKMET